MLLTMVMIKARCWFHDERFARPFRPSRKVTEVLFHCFILWNIWILPKHLMITDDATVLCIMRLAYYIIPITWQPQGYFTEWVSEWVTQSVSKSLTKDHTKGEYEIGIEVGNVWTTKGKRKLWRCLVSKIVKSKTVGCIKNLMNLFLQENIVVKE